MALPGEAPVGVLIVVQNLPVPFDRRVWLEATTLQAAGYHVSVICPTGQYGSFQARYECLEKIHIYRYPAPPDIPNVWGYLFEFAYCWLWTAFLSLKVRRQRGFDILHACNPPETYFLLGLLYKRWGCKFLFDHHDLSPEMYLAKGGRHASLIFRALLWLEKKTFQTADTVITTNQSHKRIALTRGGVAEDNVFIVRSGPDFDRLQRLPPEPALKAPYRYLVCYLGEMCEQDGVEYVLQAAHIIRTTYLRQDVKFVLMGGGPALGHLQQLKMQMGLDGMVVFTGRVSDQDLCRYLSTADVCVDPDPYTEWADQSTMNKVMEYMAFGKPIVAFDLTETRYSAQQSAVYAKPNDVQEYARLMVELLDNEPRRREMGQWGLQRVQDDLAWDYSQPTLLAAYAHILGRAKSAATPPAPKPQRHVHVG